MNQTGRIFLETISQRVLTVGLFLMGSFHLVGQPIEGLTVENYEEKLEGVRSSVISKFQQKIEAFEAYQTDLANIDALAEFANAQGNEDEKEASALSFKFLVYMNFRKIDDAMEVGRHMQETLSETEIWQQVEPYVAQLEGELRKSEILAKLIPGNTFPKFETTDLDGNKLSVEQFRGQVVLVDFWATWCGPCQGEIKYLKHAYKEYHQDGFEIIGISLDSDEQRLRNYLDVLDMQWPQYFDGKGWGNELAAQYGVSSIPASYLLDRDGTIIAVNPRGHELTDLVQQAIEES